jgi:hypothetical protein
MTRAANFFSYRSRLQNLRNRSVHGLARARCAGKRIARAHATFRFLHGLRFDPYVFVFSSKAAATEEEDLGALGSSAEVPRGGGSERCDEEVGSRPQNVEGDDRAVVHVATMPPAPAPNGSAAPEVRAEDLSALGVPEVGAESLAASAAPQVRVESLPALPHPHPAPRPRPWSWSGIPWTRLVLGGLLAVAIGYAFYKWGLPLLSEKVLPSLSRASITVLHYSIDLVFLSNFMPVLLVT